MASTTKFTFTTVTSSGWNAKNTDNLEALESALASRRRGVLGEAVEPFDSASMHMADGLWYKAHAYANCHNSAPCFGVFITGGNTGDTVTIQTEGAVTNPAWELKPGWPVMMGNTPGSVRCAALEHGNQIIGFADGDHTIYLENNFQFQDTWTSTTTTTTTVTTTSSTISTTSSTNSTTSSTISTTSTTVTGSGTTTTMSDTSTTTSSSTTTTAVPPPVLWLDGWLYRKEITISRASGAVTNYQMKVLVGETSGATGEEVDCGGHVMTSFADLRFTNSEHEPLDYWIESVTGTTPNQLATVWVECDYVGTAATVFYMYYGNPAATSASSGANTFILFDDFERGSNGDALGGIWTANAAHVISTEQTYGGTRSAKHAGVGAGYPSSYATLNASADIAISFRLYKENAATFTFLHGNGAKRINCNIDSSEAIFIAGTNKGTITADTWTKLEFCNINWTAGTLDIYKDNSSLASGSTENTVGQANVLFFHTNPSAAGADSWVDSVIVRNWRSTAPAYGTWGSETRAGWLSGWSYRKRVTVTRASGAVTNYQMKLLVGESSGATGEDVDCGGKCLSTFNDLRFTKADGATKLDYWIESITGTTPNQLATVWIEVDSISTTGTPVCMYYGNASASSASSGANTFIVFDDFERGNDGDAVGGSWLSYDSALFKISTTYAFSGTRSGRIYGNTGGTLPIAYSANTSISIRGRKDTDGGLTIRYDTDDKRIIVKWDTDENLYYYNSSVAYSESIGSASINAWHLFEINNMDTTANTNDFYCDGTLLVSGASQYTSETPTENLKIYGRVNGYYTYIDTVYARNWRAVGPVWGTWEDEETVGWLTGFSYRKKVTYSRASGAVANYQVKILVGESSGATGETVDCGGHVLSTFADLRFTSGNGETLLHYWIESITGTTPNQLATVWVDLDYTWTDATNFYMYYGDADAVSLSNGFDTFILFDDFERSSAGDALGGIWTATTASAVISTEQTYGTGSRSAKILGGSTDWTRSIECTLATSNEIAVQLRFFKEASAKFDIWHGNGTKCVVVRYEADEDILYYDTDTTANCQAEAWDFAEITNINFSAGTFDLYYTNGATAKTGATMGTDASANGKFRIYDRAGGLGVDTYIDNFMVRNWRSTGPALGAWGSEETP